MIREKGNAQPRSREAVYINKAHRWIAGTCGIVVLDNPECVFAGHNRLKSEGTAIALFGKYTAELTVTEICSAFQRGLAMKGGLNERSG
jgi:hypothetical protein